MGRTTTAVAMQLQAMGCPEVEAGIRDGATGRMIPKSWTLRPSTPLGVAPPFLPPMAAGRLFQGRLVRVVGVLAQQVQRLSRSRGLISLF